MRGIQPAIWTAKFSQMTIESLNLQTLVRCFEINDWESVAKILLRALERLQKAGADFAAILANTPHNAYELIRDESPLPIVTIMEATSAALVSDKRKRVGLLGTRAPWNMASFKSTSNCKALRQLCRTNQIAAS